MFMNGVIPNVLQIDGVGAGLRAVAFVFVVLGLHRFLFRSFLAREIRWRLEARQRPRALEIQRLRMEITHGTEYRPDATLPVRVRTQTGHPGLQAQRQLTQDEIESRRRRLEELSRSSTLRRALMYLATCAFCQCAWITLGLSLLAGCGWHAIPNALAYAMLAAMILERPSFALDERAQRQAGRTA